MDFNGIKPWVIVRKHTIDKVDVSDLHKHYNLTPSQLASLLSFKMSERSEEETRGFV